MPDALNIATLSHGEQAGEGAGAVGTTAGEGAGAVGVTAGEGAGAVGTTAGEGAGTVANSADEGAGAVANSTDEGAGAVANSTDEGASAATNSDAPDAPVMISVNNISMVFNCANEQLNSLKEYAIALAKHELRFKELRALDNVSFEVRKGDVYGILGKNGSGKSTLLKIVAGVLDPTEGSCVVHGNIAPLIELGAGFDFELTARENIYLNGALLGYSKKFIDQHFNEIVSFAEVEEFLGMPLKNYSSGMVARIAFAIATVIVPDILIVDEVLSVGDFLFQRKCEERIANLITNHGVTVLIVSHNNEQISRLCNKAIWIDNGRICMKGKAEEVCKAYQELGKSN